MEPVTNLTQMNQADSNFIYLGAVLIVVAIIFFISVGYIPNLFGKRKRSKRS